MLPDIVDYIDLIKDIFIKCLQMCKKITTLRKLTIKFKFHHEKTVMLFVAYWFVAA